MKKYKSYQEYLYSVFERLGFNVVLEDIENNELVYYKMEEDEILDVVWFYKNEKRYYNSAKSCIKLHTAIDLQIEHFGWY